MILYHGSNTEIHSIDLSLSMRGKDFGQGFYLSADKQQAEEMATFKTLQFGGLPVVNVFEFDETLLSDGTMNIKIFSDYSLEWAEFVFANRNNMSETSIHEYDFVYGPIADDRVGVQIRNLMEGNITMDVFLERLKYIKGITYQYYFGSQRAIDYLRRL
ncbi:MAG: DUF3990 domain-containing protein [Bacteroidaceae bacterium]|nr:DUF3990 domain-containing protein [Bacteroidaceae bacterium]